MILEGIICIFLLIIIYWYVDYYRHFKGLWRIPSYEFLLPLFGHILSLPDIKDMYWQLNNYTMTRGKGKWIRGCFGFIHWVNVIDPAMLENLFSNTAVINKAVVYRFLNRWLGSGLLTSSEEKWRGRRKLLTPAFHFKILEQFLEVFDKNSRILIRKLYGEVGKDKTDVVPFANLCSLDVICESAMGTSVNAQENSDSEYVKAVKKQSDFLLIRGSSLLKQLEFFYQFTQDYRDETKNLKVIHDYTMSVIKARRANLLKNGDLSSQKNDQQDDIGNKERRPFLDILLKATMDGSPLSDEDIRDEVNTFMFEGHDTTGSAVAFALYAISKNPSIQSRLLGEQRAIFGFDPDRIVTYQDLQEMKYLEMVIKETLRLYPSVPLYGREFMKDVVIDEFRFKKGTQIAFMVYSLHRNPDIYPDPEEFDPERFTPEEQAKRHPYAFLPFSAGFRNCIGQKFAMMEMKTTLGMLIRKFIFHATGDELKLRSGLILSSENGVNLRIRNRQWN